MVLVLKEGASKTEIADIEKKLYELTTAMGFDARKYNGILKLDKDPLEIQKELEMSGKEILVNIPIFPVFA